jgi:D-beta-D-heptose 7-phosphate kinase/D-beta-D-heptose 1-phosphate adenosyltransferase
VVAVTDHSFTLGGAGNVANNLRALEAHVSFAAAIGEDAFAHYVADILGSEGVSADGLVRIPDRPTTRKTRVVAHNQQVVRADWESTSQLSAQDRDRLCEIVRRGAKDADAVVLSDYAKGLFSRELVEASLGCPIVLADPKPQNLQLFTGVTCVAPNVHEAAQATGIAITDDASLERAGAALLEALRCGYVVITRGEHGMSLFGRGGERLHIPSVARTVFDVSGAGDTVIAVLSLALAAGAPIELAMQLANFAAGAVVEKLGTATASAQEILALVEHER